MSSASIWYYLSAGTGVFNYSVIFAFKEAWLLGLAISYISLGLEHFSWLNGAASLMAPLQV